MPFPPFLLLAQLLHYKAVGSSTNPASTVVKWMAENLRTTKYNDGTIIPNITDNAEWIGLTIFEC